MDLKSIQSTTLQRIAPPGVRDTSKPPAEVSAVVQTESFVAAVPEKVAPEPAALPTPPAYPSALHVTTMIVGGGVGGLYTAWRMAGADGSEPKNDPQSIGVFERSKRLGGRIDSVAPPGMPDIKSEFGGMRYLESQPIITSLIGKLKLKSELFAVSGKGTLAYLKGERVPAADIGKLGQAYNVPVSEQGKSPAQLWGGAISSVVPGAADLSNDDWTKLQQTGSQTVIDPETGQARQEPFFNIGMTDAVKSTISPEGLDFVRDGLGYDHFVNNVVNSGTLMESITHDFTGNAPFRTLSNGMSDIPNTLASQFQEKGGAIHEGFDLETFDYDTQKKTWIVTFNTEEGKQTYTADNLVLAMPRRALERVAEKTPLLANPDVQKMLGAVTPYPAMKILLAYHEPWWKDHGIEGGRSVSDTDLRQTYYLGSEADKEDGKNGNQNSLMLGGYVDGRSFDNWKKLLPADHYAGAPGEDATGEGRWQQHEIPAPMLTEVERQLQQIHGDDKKIPAPYSAVAQVWDGPIYGGSVNYWNKGVDPSQLAQEVLTPLQHVKGYENASLHIVGEAYAWSKEEGAQQGWVEGALQTAEDAVELLGKKPPEWMPPATS